MRRLIYTSSESAYSSSVPTKNWSVVDQTFTTQDVHLSCDSRPTITPLFQPRFSLDLSGVAGLLGGDDAVSAMTAVHVYGNRRWLGWYNNPGSFQIAKRFGKFAQSISLHGIFGDPSSKSLSKNVHMDLASLSESDSPNLKGPKFRAAHSGTIIEETGYLASFLMKECGAWDSDSERKVVPGRETQPIGITIADLSGAPPSEMYPARSTALTFLAACVPIAASMITCAVCAVRKDWYASSLILIGIIASGISCRVLGSAEFVFTHPQPAARSPAGDGILSSDKEIVLLRGKEGAVNSITRGQFSLRFSSAAHYNLIRWCSRLFFIQCLAQFLLMPHATLFGQIMFLVSIGVSALYNAWLASPEKDKIRRKRLFEKVLEDMTVTKYTLGTRVAAVVFILLVLELRDPTKLLDELLPNDTRVWKQWKSTILQELRHARDHHPFLVEKDLPVEDVRRLTRPEQDLLNLFYEDARAAYIGYKGYLEVHSS